jgi:hypothetical protein
MSLGAAWSSAKIESALSEPSRFGGATGWRVILGLGASDLPPKKKFLIEERADFFCGGSGVPLLVSSARRMGV